MHYNQTIEYIMDSNEWIAKKKHNAMTLWKDPKHAVVTELRNCKNYSQSNVC